ncbi:sensor histidine kinase [Pseudonocardia sp. ICBG601]|uniref:sensor histidine kinase n=1 Tax=Pseudonocardia sp. ICBG601 TaxID=2846759 RepID=UPI001CF70AB4|nr:histidine kinase [Pseudonocardia sp. ICBG601]
MTTRRRSVGEIVVVGLAIGADLYVYGGDGRLRGDGELPAWVVPVVEVVVLATLLLRWRYPYRVFALQWCWALAGLVLPGFAPFAGLLVALHAVACRASARYSLAVLAAGLVPLAVSNANAAGGVGTRFFAALCLAWAVVLAAVWAVGQRTHLAERRTRLVEELRERDAADAVRAERLRLARELHDIVAHTVSAMVLQTAGARARLTAGPDDDPTRAEVVAALAAVEASGVTAMTEMHRMLGLLRAHAPDPDPAGDGVVAPRLADVPHLLETSRASGLDVEHVVDGTPGRADPSVELTAFRVVQEGLANAIKHGGAGALVRVHELWEPGRLRITVRSTPGIAGPDHGLPVGGHGLRGLAERAALVGGHIESGPGGDGFVLRAELPLDRSGAGAR